MDINTSALVPMFVIGMAVSAMSVTISKGNIFKSFREWVKKHNGWIGKLVSCFYCAGHWITFPFVIYYRPRVLVSSVLIFDLTVSTFAIIAWSALLSGVIFRLIWGSNDD